MSGRRRYKPWSERLAAAEKRGYFTETEKDYASSWMTCAVGEKYNYPRFEEYAMSMDEDRLGTEFMYDVTKDNIESARRVYTQIMALPPEAD